MSRTKAANFQNELLLMCEMFVQGATLTDVCIKAKCTVSTARARRASLTRIGIEMTTERLPGRGYGTPRYYLGEPLVRAVQKIRRYFTPSVQKKILKPAEKDDRCSRTGRSAGYGIECWLFITKVRSDAYRSWCEPWTLK